MSVMTFEAVIENGQVRLPVDVVLPERKTVYVVVPGDDMPLNRAIAGFRMAHPENARNFDMKVIWREEA